MQGARTRSVESPSGCHRLKYLIDCTILALRRSNALPPNQQTAQIGVGIAETAQCIKITD